MDPTSVEAWWASGTQKEAAKEEEKHKAVPTRKESLGMNVGQALGDVAIAKGLKPQTLLRKERPTMSVQDRILERTRKRDLEIILQQGDEVEYADRQRVAQDVKRIADDPPRSALIPPGATDMCFQALGLEVGPSHIVRR